MNIKHSLITAIVATAFAAGLASAEDFNPNGYGKPAAPGEYTGALPANIADGKTKEEARADGILTLTEIAKFGDIGFSDEKGPEMSLEERAKAYDMTVAQVKIMEAEDAVDLKNPTGPRDYSGTGAARCADKAK